VEQLKVEILVVQLRQLSVKNEWSALKSETPETTNAASGQECTHPQLNELSEDKIK
jgi:hypothetical protein